jgi:hypothetical protein
MFCVFQAKTQSKSTQQAYEGKHKVKITQLLVKSTRYTLDNLPHIYSAENPRNKKRPPRMQQE